MRYPAAILLAVSCCLAGQQLANRLHARVKALETVLLMLQDIRAQLEYLSPPVADILECLCRRESLRRLTFLQDCRTSMQNGLNFPDAWQAALSGRQEELRGEDCEKLLAFGAGFGTTDLSGQLAGCALCSEMLGEQLTHAREAFRTYGKLYPMLGMLTGIALAVAVL